MADDLEQFKIQEKNTQTTDGEVRHSSDNFKFIDVETTTQSFVQKKQRQYKEEQTKLSKIQAIQDQETSKLVKEMNNQVNLFERGLETENWENARQIYAQIKDKMHPSKPLKVDTKKIYQNSFSFPEVAKNDYAANELNNLEAAQNNLNQNPENETLMNKFVEVAMDTADNLIKKYPGIWTDPSLEVKKEKRNEQLALLSTE